MPDWTNIGKPTGAARVSSFNLVGNTSGETPAAHGDTVLRPYASPAYGLLVVVVGLTVANGIRGSADILQDLDGSTNFGMSAAPPLLQAASPLPFFLWAPDDRSAVFHGSVKGSSGLVAWMTTARAALLPPPVMLLVARHAVKIHIRSSSTGSTSCDGVAGVCDDLGGSKRLSA